MADDYNNPTFVEKALAVMKRDPSIIVCYPRATLIDNDGENPCLYEDNLHLMQDDPSDNPGDYYWTSSTSVGQESPHNTEATY